MVEVAPPRRRSVDVGGLALALSDGAHGHGWGGWDEEETGGTRRVPVLFIRTQFLGHSSPLHLPPWPSHL